MKSAIESIILQHNPKSIPEYKRSLKQLLQSICLMGLSRSNFFDKAAFYGGTALRMLYDLNRFSEDLDFSLIESDRNFALDNYTSFVKKELEAWSIQADVKIIEKSKSNIESAFIKSNTLLTLIEFKIPKDILGKLHKNEVSKVKFEIDTNPPCTFNSEISYILEPIPYSVRSMSPSDLFAGKMHAILARNWKSRVKGRDWYDLIWFIKNNVKINLGHLKKRLIQSKHLDPESNFKTTSFINLLIERIEIIDFNKAKQDVLPFIANNSELNIWSKDFFMKLIEKIKIENK